MMHESFKFDGLLRANFAIIEKTFVKIHAWDICDARAHLSENHENFDFSGVEEKLIGTSRCVRLIADELHG